MNNINNQKKEEFLNSLEAIELDDLTIDLNEANKVYDSFSSIIEGQKSVNSFLTNTVSQYILAHVCQENHVFLNHIDTRYSVDDVNFTDSDLIFALKDMKEEEINKFKDKFSKDTRIIKVDDSKLIKKNIVNVIDEDERTR